MLKSSVNKDERTSQRPIGSELSATASPRFPGRKGAYLERTYRKYPIKTLNNSLEQPRPVGKLNVGFL